MKEIDKIKQNNQTIKQLILRFRIKYIKNLVG